MVETHSPTPSDTDFDVINADPDSQKAVLHMRDADYYCDSVVILVQNTLFNVPRAILTQSTYFRELYLVQPIGNLGSCDSSPIRLENHLSQDFKLLLRLLLPLQHGVSLHLSADESMSLLGIASSLQFPTVRNEAITQLSQYALQDPILKLIAAKKYDLDGWLVSAINALAQRNKPLDHADVQRLHALGKAEDVIDLILKIATIREQFSSIVTPGCSRCHPCRRGGCASSVSRGAYDFTPRIHELLGYGDDSATSSALVISADEERTRSEAIRTEQETDELKRQAEQQAEEAAERKRKEEDAAAAERKDTLEVPAAEKRHHEEVCKRTEEVSSRGESEATSGAYWCRKVKNKAETQRIAEAKRQDEDDFAAAVSALHMEEQPKFWAAWTKAEAAETALAAAQSKAVFWKRVVIEEEQAATQLEEQGVTNPIKKARAVAARRKADATATLYSPYFLAVDDAECLHAESLKALGELRASLPPSATCPSPIRQ